MPGVTGNVFDPTKEVTLRRASVHSTKSLGIVLAAVTTGIPALANDKDRAAGALHV
jgi:hypothetical protein